MSRYEDRPIRPVWAEIDLKNIGINIQAIREWVGPNVQIMAVVKAEAYGHGALRVAKAARDAGASWFGVSMPEEGIALRKAGFCEPILIFGPLQAEQAGPVVHHDLTPTLCSIEAATALSKEAAAQGRRVSAHVKIDTGMGRVGVHYTEARSYIEAVQSLPGLEIQGIYSHFATADETDLSYARQQLGRFQETLKTLEDAGIRIPIRHIANSAGVINLPEAHFDLVRPGIIIYGLAPSDALSDTPLHLQPAFSLKTRVTQVKRVPKGTGVSYGQLYHSSKETTIATIPIGYADGWSRLLTGKAQALIHGKRFPIVGRICMDQCMVDVGDEQVNTGELVTLIGRQKEQEITVDEVAGLLGTINYEVVCMISDRVPRVYL